MRINPDPDLFHPYKEKADKNKGKHDKQHKQKHKSNKKNKKTH